jgi:hypothetical protein
MKRHISVFIVFLLLLFVINKDDLEPSEQGPSQIRESFLAALKVRDFLQLGNCFHPDIQIGYLTPNRTGKVSGSMKVMVAIRIMFGSSESFTIEEANVKVLSDNKILISYRFRVGADTYYEQRVFAIVKDGLIESFNLLCSGSFTPGN